MTCTECSCNPSECLAASDGQGRRIRELEAALRSINGVVTRAVAEHVRDPSADSYAEGEYDRRLVRMQKAVTAITRVTLEKGKPT